MTDINHRRKNRAPVTMRYDRYSYNNGYAVGKGNERGDNQRVGKTDYLDKSMHGASVHDKFTDKHIGAQIGNDFCNGHRGMAKAVRGAKKFVRSRLRFNANAKTKQLANMIELDDDQ